jgi:hypothetical protein
VRLVSESDVTPFRADRGLPPHPTNPDQHAFATRQNLHPQIDLLMPDVQTPDLRTVLENAQTIAVVGCSGRSSRTSYKIARYMQNRGYRIVPVNPNYDEVLGEPCYPDLPSVPADIEIDIVDIFRRPDHTADMMRTALERIQQSGERPVIWTQLGVSSTEAEKLAAEAGLPYVRNRCIKVAYDRLFA